MVTDFDPRRNEFTVSVDAGSRISTGVSAADRAMTISYLIDPHTKPSDLSRPGHVFPLRYCTGGVLRRPGCAEATVDLCRLAGKAPAGVLCEIMTDDKSKMAGLTDLRRFAARFSLPIVSIRDLIGYRMRTERVVHQATETRFPLGQTQATCYLYESTFSSQQHLALVVGDVANKSHVPVRIHSECLVADIFGSRWCACQVHLQSALARMEEEGCGVLVYIRGHQGQEASLVDGLLASDPQSHEHPHPVSTEAYDLGVQILTDLGVSNVQLVTNDSCNLAVLRDLSADKPNSAPLDRSEAATLENIVSISNPRAMTFLPQTVDG
jgi:3,4-dihydroxy 2-butanone 4-phosphate synthase/GTP cyclohydrolase II